MLSRVMDGPMDRGQITSVGVGGCTWAGAQSRQFYHYYRVTSLYPMPPQPGVFPLPYASTSTHKARANPIEIHNGTTDIVTNYPPSAHHTIHHPSSTLLAGQSSRSHGTSLLCPVSCIKSFAVSQVPTPMTGRRTEGARRS